MTGHPPLMHTGAGASCYTFKIFKQDEYNKFLGMNASCNHLFLLLHSSAAYSKELGGPSGS